ncbi:DHS-like NAD/FAD-binding domain-containing protein [Choiromyces venosus 120613-1]|uniref:DHS-like NAD/FAD-binding domain-containing protein n=1 Tax=Choiromyces venosus 120613-1 TaxID=1336337 RepID=A0A3N4K2X6_9PEZI|nr:DHS-like NAD/FAD-binding domain-containing protein [Choiromyces venosus 120613-1]
MVAPRIPYVLPFPPPPIHPKNATTLSAAIDAVTNFLESRNTVILTGAGVSVESGLADYRGEKGTYRLNRTYRPIFFEEFVGNHEARKRYWARSFLGWPTMEKAKPNRTHKSISILGTLGVLNHVLTQNVDSLHHTCHPYLRTTELHGTLRTLTCLTCHSPYPRVEFQKTLAELNPKWAEFLHTATEAGIFDNDHRREQSIKTNPDGDVDIPGAPYTKFHYPPCPKCLNSNNIKVLVDKQGSHQPNELSATNGVLKPSVTFFGESVALGAKAEAEEMVDKCGGILVVGSSLATYSAYRLAKAAHDAGKDVGIVNLGGVRGEDFFFSNDGKGKRVRVDFSAGDILGGVVKNFGGEVVTREQDEIPPSRGGVGLEG